MQSKLMQIKRVSTLLIMVLVLAACGTTTERLLLQGNQAFLNGDYDAALLAYRQAQEQTPTDAAPIYNMANTFYRQEVYTQTQQLMPRAVNLAEGDLMQHGQYNLGNAHFQTQDWGAAVDAYKAALRLNPDDQDAKYNLELALQQQAQNPQKEGQQDGDQNDEAGQEEENQEQQDSSEQDEQNADEQNQDEQSQGEQSDQEQSEEESNQEQNNEEQNSEEQEGEQGEQNQPDQAQPAQSAPQSPQQTEPTEGLTEEQARQLLQIVGQNSDTLQEQMQQRSAGSAPPPEKDW